MNGSPPTDDFSSFNRPLIVASHPRSGTHLTLDLLRRQFTGCEVRNRLFSFRDAPYINLDEILSLDQELCSREVNSFTRVRIPLVKTHRLPSFDEPYQFLNPVSEERMGLARYLEQNAHKVYIYRDIKSTMISLFYFIPEAQRGNDIHDFIRQVRGNRQLSRIGFWAYHVARWLECKNVFALYYGRLLKETDKCLHELGQFLHEPVRMQQPLLPGLPKNLLTRRFGTFFSRNPVSTAIMSFEERRYTVDSFTDADEQFIESEIETIEPGLLERLDLV